MLEEGRICMEGGRRGEGRMEVGREKCEKGRWKEM